MGSHVNGPNPSFVHILLTKLPRTMAPTDMEDFLETTPARAKLDPVRRRHDPVTTVPQRAVIVTWGLPRFLEKRRVEYALGEPRHPTRQIKAES